MTEFEITVNGEKENIHAKHLGNGKYIVRRLKTCNFAEVKSIETLFGNDGNHQYRINGFYPTSKFAGIPKVKQTVTKIKTKIN